MARKPRAGLSEPDYLPDNQGMNTTHTHDTLYRRDGSTYTGTVTADASGAATVTEIETCGRCGGAGGFERWPGFTCFECGGKRRVAVETRVYTAERLAKLNAAADKRAARVAAKHAAAQAAEEAAIAARREAFEAQHGALLARVAGLTEPIVADIVGKARHTATLTDKQAALLLAKAEQAEAQAATAAISGHVGTVGERLTVAVTVARVATFERPAYASHYMETVYVVTMLDAAGNQIVSRSPRFEAEAGEAFTLRATVKEHGEYRGAKQTLVERAARK